MRLFLILWCLIWPTLTFAMKKEGSSYTQVSVVEGTLTQVSRLPVAEANPYPDCYYTAVLDVAHISSGESIGKRIVLVIPGFFGRQYAAEAKYKVGDKIRTTVVPFASMPEKVRQTQQADEIEELDLDFYFPAQISTVTKFETLKSSISFSNNNKKGDESITFQKKDLTAKAARQEQIRHDLEEINQLLSKHGGDWNKWYDSLYDLRAQYQKQNDSKAQRWIGDSFFSAGDMYSGSFHRAEFVESAILFKNYLAARNIDLILVRVPMKGEIVEDLFITTPEDKVINPYLLRMYKELLEADIEIITDIIPRAREARLKYPLMFYYQDFPECHPAEGISWVIAEEFVKRISRYERIKSKPKQIFSLKETSTTERWLNYKWPSGNPKFSPNDDVRYSSVVDDKGKALQLKQGLDSPVLIIGDSYIVTPSLSKGASIPHYLAYLAGMTPDIFQRYKADSMLPRLIAREGEEFLRNRSVVLFPVAPFVPFKAFASLPILNPDKSVKTLLASYSGSAMHDFTEFSAETPNKAFSYSSDGTIEISPSTKDNNVTVRLRIKLPHKIDGYGHFILGLDCASKDNQNVKVTYSGQTDSIKRYETQSNNEDLFSFTTKADHYVTMDFTDDLQFPAALKIKGIKVYGVEKPVSRNGNDRQD